MRIAAGFTDEWKKTAERRARMRGKVEVILRQLSARFGELDNETSSRVKLSSMSELDAICDRLLVAKTLEQALGTQQDEQ